MTWLVDPGPRFLGALDPASLGRVDRIGQAKAVELYARSARRVLRGEAVDCDTSDARG